MPGMREEFVSWMYSEMDCQSTVFHKEIVRQWRPEHRQARVRRVEPIAEVDRHKTAYTYRGTQIVLIVTREGPSQQHCIGDDEKGKLHTL